MLIEVVTHCYCKNLEQYARLLCYQLSSFVLFKPKTCRIRSTICVDKDDEIALSTVNWYMENTDVDINLMKLTNGEISQRAIGRNMAAKNSEADIIWFSDCDYVFRGAIDSLAQVQWNEDTTIVFPSKIHFNSAKEFGNELIKQMDRPRIADVDTDLFRRRIEDRPIGGTHIVRGDFAREHGYLSGDWHEQKTYPWVLTSTRCDVSYRMFCKSKGNIQRADIPGTFRIRHTESAIKPTSELMRIQRELNNENRSQSDS